MPRLPSEKAVGPYDRKINSTPSRRAVWRHTLRSFKALVGTRYAGPGNGSEMIRFQTCSSAFRHRSKAASELGRICLANRSQGNVNGIPHLPPQPGNYVDKCLWKFRHNMSGNIFFSGSVVHEDDSFPSAAAMDLYGCGCKG